MPIRTFQELRDAAAGAGPRRVAVVAAANREILEAAHEAHRAHIAECVLIDEPGRLRREAEALGLSLDGLDVVQARSREEAARLSMEMARAGEVQVVMKGALETAAFMRVALDRETGVRESRLFTHVAVYEVPGYGRLLLISDAGVVVAPDLAQKVEIVQNAIDVAHCLGLAEPKVAILAAAELVNPKIPTTLDAAILAKMAERGQIHGGIVDGPLALDNAISEDSGRIKGIHSPVLGQADILIVPDVEAGNLLAKAITYFGKGEMAGVVVGGSVPLVVTSRSDSRVTKLISIALGVLLAAGGCRDANAGGSRR